jgi:hypothetical protein
MARIERIKRGFHLPADANNVLDRLLMTQSASSESAALASLAYGMDEDLRETLDEQGLRLYKAGKLNRSAMLESQRRVRERRKAQNASQPVAA